jgi:hypothetical protein
MSNRPELTVTISSPSKGISVSATSCAACNKRANRVVVYKALLSSEYAVAGAALFYLSLAASGAGHNALPSKRAFRTNRYC